MNRLPSDTAKYFLRLFRYVWQEKRLMLLSTLFGVAGLCLPFVYPWIIGRAIDTVMLARPVNGVAPTMDQRLHWLIALTAAAALTAFAWAVAGYCKGHFTLQLGNQIVTRLRHDLFEHFQKLSLQFYSKERTGGIVWRLVHEVHGVANVIYAGVLLLAFDIIQLVVATLLLMSISWKLAAAVLCLLPFYVLTFYVFNPKVRSASDAVSRHISQISGKVQEQFSAMALVKTYAAEERETARFMADNQRHLSYVLHQSHLGHAMGAISEILVHLGTTIIIGYGCWIALHDPAFTAGDLTKFLGFVGIMYGPVRRFADMNLVYQNSLSSVRRIFRVFDIKPKIEDKVNAITRSPSCGDVVYENVRFRYGDDSDESRIRLDEDEPEDSPFLIKDKKRHYGPWILNGVNLRIHAGERVALVGPSGSGKTTLASLLPRLYDVQQGAITVDGIDIRDYSLKALRSAIGIVQQDSFLFSGSIRENILYGKPEASEAELIAAAKAANAHGFITAVSRQDMTRRWENGA